MDTTTPPSVRGGTRVAAEAVTDRATDGDENRTTAVPVPDRPWEELVTSALLGTDRRPPAGLTRTGTGGGAGIGG
ncbi:hypothetical protein GT043_05125, partial [Streptomyces sp. SID2131]|nr:hypothetical protein [Streptomyces sp. SID2131]